MSGKFVVLLFLFFIVSSAWVYRDARKNKIGKTPDESAKNNRSAGGWAAQGMILYLRNRKDLLGRAVHSPVEPSGYAGWAVIGGFSLVWLFMASSVFKGGVVEALTSKTAAPISMAETKDATLFKSFKYGQSINDFSVDGQYEDCSSEVGQPARCSAEEIEFMGQNYSVVLIFTDNSLASVSLFADFSEEAYRKLMASLPKSGFSLAMLQGKSDRLDLVETLNKESQSTLISRMSAFESVNLEAGHLAYVFVELPASELKEHKNTVEAITKMPATKRELDVTVTEDAESAQLILSFTIPRLALHKMANSGQVSNEKF